MKEFGNYFTAEKKINKVCPDCRYDILPEWDSAYNLEWCPYCGLNIDELKEKGLLPDNE